MRTEFQEASSAVEHDTIVNKLSSNPITLTFLDQTTEAEYKAEFYSKSTSYLRAAFFICTVCFICFNLSILRPFWISDPDVYNPAVRLTLIIRGVTLLGLIMNLLVTYHTSFVSLAQVSVGCVFNLLVLYHLLTCMITSPEQTSHHMYAAGLWVALHGPFLKIRFVHGIIMCSAFLAFTEVILRPRLGIGGSLLGQITSSAAQVTTDPTKGNDISFAAPDLLLSAILGLSSSYMYEKSVRQAFMLSRTLRDLMIHSSSELQQAMDRENRIVALMDASSDATVPQEKSVLAPPGQQLRRLLERVTYSSLSDISEQEPLVAVPSTLPRRSLLHMTRAYSMGDFESSSKKFM